MVKTTKKLSTSTRDTENSTKVASESLTQEAQRTRTYEGLIARTGARAGLLSGGVMFPSMK
jgi:hypothetical protein